MEIKNNQVTLSGVVKSGFIFSHTVCGENFYMVTICSERLSEEADYLPLMISDRLFDIKQDLSGKFIVVNGQFRSYNDWKDGRSRLKLYVYARDIQITEHTLPKNYITLDGFLCKESVYRKTPKGKNITDLMIAVNRPYGKSDYIPCICWGRNARFAASLFVGCHVRLEGRIQSREYGKVLPSGEREIHTAYEVSVSKIEEVYGE